MSSPNSAMAAFEELALQDGSLRWYAIADSAQHRSLPDVLLHEGVESRCLFGATLQSPLAKKSPHLVQLGSPVNETRAWKWIRLNAKFSPCLSVIATPKTFDELFNQLLICTEVLLPDGDAMFLAFWDPAVLGTLIGQKEDHTLHVPGPVLRPDQKRMLTNGLSAWWYWDRTEMLHSIAFDWSEGFAPDASMQLDQNQVDALVEASVPDHVLYYVELNQPHLISDVPLLWRYRTVRTSLVQARNIGLQTMRDLVDFVCVDLIYKERMNKDPVIVGLLKRIELGQLTFRDALSGFP